MNLACWLELSHYEGRFHLETVRKLLKLLERIFTVSSKCPLKSLDNQADFDSDIQRFDSSPPPEGIRTQTSASEGNALNAAVVCPEDVARRQLEYPKFGSRPPALKRSGTHRTAPPLFCPTVSVPTTSSISAFPQNPAHRISNGRERDGRLYRLPGRDRLYAAGTGSRSHRLAPAFDSPRRALISDDAWRRSWLTANFSPPKKFASDIAEASQPALFETGVQ
jgi:hypothetical protein